MNNNTLVINKNIISATSKTYFIADIAANHDGDLSKAKDLIYMVKEAGADAAKFQHFKAKTIISDRTFKSLGKSSSHQKDWKKTVYQTYKSAEVPLEWTEILADTCRKADIDFFTSPYDKDDINKIDKYVPAYKVGSGDITYDDIILEMAKFGKPMLLATGASNILDVTLAINKIREINTQIVLMQCNTNYTASDENLKYINLNVLRTYALLFPDAILGLSDHTLGCTTVLGAVALGAKVIEKHFTDDNKLQGPDHKFSMNPLTWKEMVERTRELEYSMGTTEKKVENNEKETVILQRRSLCATRNLIKGEIISDFDICALRPAPENSISPRYTPNVLGKKILRNYLEGESLQWSDLSND